MDAMGVGLPEWVRKTKPQITPITAFTGESNHETKQPLLVGEKERPNRWFNGDWKMTKSSTEMEKRVRSKYKTQRTLSSLMGEAQRWWTKNHWREAEKKRSSSMCIKTAKLKFSDFYFPNLPLALLNLEEAQLTPILRLGARACAGIISISATYPMDMVRGRLIVQTEASPCQYREIYHALSTVLREEGPRALYKGWLPRALSELIPDFTISNPNSTFSKGYAKLLEIGEGKDFKPRNGRWNLTNKVTGWEFRVLGFWHFEMVSKETGINNGRIIQQGISWFEKNGKDEEEKIKC
ncbi:hypothetical protein V8G54_017409 [Vigna mungo]|uniref:Uncharacterized protein n=1 Tax=Vigna mungo TaxID=3915 RepID=A0AAQ3RYP9_VIGMU